MDAELTHLIVGIWSARACGPGLLRRIAAEERLDVIEPGSTTWERVERATTARQRPALESLAGQAQRFIAQGEKEARRLESVGARVLIHGQPGYPSRLAMIGSPPPVLAVRGSVAVLETSLVAVVGTREASSGGLERCRGVVRAAGEEGHGVVSGGAYGIDAAAHETALDIDAPTVVVFGTDIERTYPREHGELYERVIAQGGALVSQFARNTYPRRLCFPKRNTTIAGLARATIVVEAPEGSGALLTARAATSQRRPVMVVAAPAFDPRSSGGLAWVKSGRAWLLDGPDDLRRALEGGRTPSTGATPGSQGRLQFAAPAAGRRHGGTAPAVPHAESTDGACDEPASETGVDAAALRADLREAVEHLGELGTSMSRDAALSMLDEQGVPTPHATLLELELAGRLIREAGERYRLVVSMT